jgi:hypothetical protein
MRGYRFLVLSVLLFGVCFLAGAQELPSHHDADTNFDNRIGLSELLRVIQFFNAGGYGCDVIGSPAPSEDGYLAGPGDEDCPRHNSDYLDPPWLINLTELLRLIQMFNSRIYGFDPTTEDGFKPIFTPEDTTASVQGDLEDVRRFLDESEDENLDQETKDTFEEILILAETEYLKGEPCTAADILDEGLELSQKERRASRARDTFDTEILFARIREVQFRILTSGEMPPLCPGRERENREPEYETGENSADRFVVAPRFGAPRFLPTWQRLPDGSEGYFTQLLLPGFSAQEGEPGTPGIPCARQLVAVPPGAFVQLFEEAVLPSQTLTLKLAPFQEDPADQAIDDLPFPDREIFADRPFVLNEEIYAANRFFPPTPYSIQPLGQMRGLEVYLLEMCSGQYNPVTEELRLFEEMELRVEFSNGPEGFASEFMAQPFESNPDLFFNAVLNVEALTKSPFIPELINPNIIGEELIILTHPNFRDAADRLAEWKRQKGIVTSVFNCGTGSGVQGRQTSAEIDAFIETRYASTSVKASYILLMGDAEYIPPHYVARSQIFESSTTTIGTDHPYAVIPIQVGPFTIDILPTFAVGRIPVDTLAQADAVVDKIIAYEKTPPSAPASQGFYRRIMLAAQFQCCRTDVAQNGTAQRTFTEVSEFVRPPLVNRGYDARRLYRRTIDNGCATCDPPRPAYTNDPTPRRYYDGTPIPSAIGPGSSFAWSATTNDVINLFNQGVVLAFHRDHGWPGGWGTPSFTWNHLPINNGVFTPIIFSINCSSGVFDNETSSGAEDVTFSGIYWAERILRQANGGAIGVIGDTRVSPSWANSALSRGLFDAVFPETVPGYGGNKRHRRLGDMLNHAKLYLLTQIGTTFVGGDTVRDMFWLYHVLGDPTLEMWTDAPNPILLPGLQILGVSEKELEFTFASAALAGAELTLYQPSERGEDIPVGRGIVMGDGSVRITPFQLWEPDDDVFFALTREDLVAGDGSVRLLF